jgi:hypothetical protein
LDEFRESRDPEETLGSTHPFVAENLMQRAKLLRKIGDDSGATRLEERAQAIREQSS